MGKENHYTQGRGVIDSSIGEINTDIPPKIENKSSPWPSYEFGGYTYQTAVHTQGYL